MRMLWKVIVLIVGVLLAGVAEPAVAGSATQNDGAPVVVSGGGMSPVASGLQESTAQCITATHTDLQGTTHHSVSNSCIVP